MKRPAVFFDRDNTLIACNDYLGDVSRVALVEGALVTAKVPSTPRDQSEGVLASLRAADAGEVAAFAHGMTVATNALLERRAAARSARDFATADRLRDQLAAAGVEVRDGPSGAEWILRE